MRVYIFFSLPLSLSVCCIMCACGQYSTLLMPQIHTLVDVYSTVLSYSVILHIYSHGKTHLGHCTDLYSFSGGEP